MKKMFLLAAAVSMSFASAGRSEGSATTDLVFNTQVVAGCAVSLAGQYASQTGATYSGTDASPEALNISAGEAASAPLLRCQTGTGVSISAGEAAQGFTGGQMDSPDASTVALSGDMSLVLDGWANTYNSNDDNKTLRGAYSVVFTKRNIAGGNGDTYALTAAFTPSRGQFEPMVGNYSGTLNVAINY